MNNNTAYLLASIIQINEPMQCSTKYRFEMMIERFVQEKAKKKEHAVSSTNIDDSAIFARKKYIQILFEEFSKCNSCVNIDYDMETNNKCVMFLRSGHLLLLLLLSLLFLLIFVFYKMTYGNELLPRHSPFFFYDYCCFFIIFSALSLPVFTYYLYLFVLINTRFIRIINRFIRNLKERARGKCADLCMHNTQILRINILI